MVQLAQDRFDVKLEFKFYGDHNSKEEWIFSKLKASQYLVYSTDSYFPIRLENNLIGVVHVHGTLSNEQARMMMEMVELIVDSTLKAALDLSSLEMLEGKMQLLDPEQNVLRMDQYQQKPMKLLHLLSAPDASLPLNRFCRFISEMNIEDRRKKAFDAHEKTGNYAFLDIDDLSEETFESHQAFSELGAVTVFVPEVSDLNAVMQNFLSDYFSKDEYKKGPSVAFGSRYPFFEPKVEFMVEPGLFQTLKSHLDYAPDSLIFN